MEINRVDRPFDQQVTSTLPNRLESAICPRWTGAQQRAMCRILDIQVDERSTRAGCDPGEPVRQSTLRGLQNVDDKSTRISDRIPQVAIRTEHEVDSRLFLCGDQQ